ncbi:hypothetical protein ASG81_23755 [Paenibacillus sp. Soil522]|nr:hypothetical protein ASG81_23755 [Paenibacillus sp. Soil522]
MGVLSAKIDRNNVKEIAAYISASIRNKLYAYHLLKMRKGQRKGIRLFFVLGIRGLSHQTSSVYSIAFFPQSIKQSAYSCQYTSQ